MRSLRTHFLGLEVADATGLTLGQVVDTFPFDGGGELRWSSSAPPLRRAAHAPRLGSAPRTASSPCFTRHQIEDSPDLAAAATRPESLAREVQLVLGRPGSPARGAPLACWGRWPPSSGSPARRGRAARFQARRRAGADRPRRAPVEAAGRRLARLGVEFGACYTSPKVRARDTAGWRAGCSTWSRSRGAHEGFDGEAALELLAPTRRRGVLVVGHEPDFSQVVHDLTGGRVDFKKGGVAAVRVARGVGRADRPPAPARARVARRAVPGPRPRAPPRSSPAPPRRGSASEARARTPPGCGPRRRAGRARRR